MTSLEVQYSTCGLTCELCDQLLDGFAAVVARLYLSYLARIWHVGWGVPQDLTYEPRRGIEPRTCSLRA
jgi:hypothetical protein